MRTGQRGRGLGLRAIGLIKRSASDGTNRTARGSVPCRRDTHFYVDTRNVMRLIFEQALIRTASDGGPQVEQVAM